jgi:hypothetical protein
MAAEGVLLFGADGQLGHELQAELSVVGRLKPLTLADVDIADAKALQAVIRHHAPRYIVNAAAYTAVDKAEQEPDLAHAINATAPGIMAAEAEGFRGDPGALLHRLMFSMGVQPSPTRKATLPTRCRSMGAASAMAMCKSWRKQVLFSSSAVLGWWARMAAIF